MLSKKHFEELKKHAKRRARRPAPKFGPPLKLAAHGNLERRMTRDYADVLQNVEFGLVTAFRESNEVDDRIVDMALRAAIGQKEPDDPHARRVIEHLSGLRLLRGDISDEEWRDALRVVFASVRRHSQCRAGDTAYLDFVSPYLP